MAYWFLIPSLILTVFSTWFSPYTLRPARTVFVWENALLMSAFRGPFLLLNLVLMFFHFELAQGQTESYLRLLFRLVAFLNAWNIILLGIPLFRFIFNHDLFDLEMRQIFPVKTFKKYEPHFLRLFSFGNYTYRGRTLYKFKNRSGEELPIALWKAKDPKAPCVINVFGGGYTIGSVDQFPQYNQFLRSLDVHVLCLPYHLIPKMWPSQVHDVVDAWKYSLEKLPGWGIDPEFFILSGRSAGAHIGLCAWDELRDPRVKGMISFYCPFNFRSLLNLSYPGDILGSKERLEALFGKNLDQNKIVETSSPYGFVDSQFPPMLFIHGLSDSMIPYQTSVEFAKKMEALKGRHFYLELEDEDHGFEVNLNGPGGQKSCWAIQHFIQHLKDSERKSDKI